MPRLPGVFDAFVPDQAEPEPVQTDPPRPAPSPFDRFAREAVATDNVALGASLSAGQAMDPARQARVFGLQAKTGLPTSILGADLDRIEAQVNAGHVDPAELRRNSPAVAMFLKEHPGLANDDVANLRAAETLLRGRPLGPVGWLTEHVSRWTRQVGERAHTGQLQVEKAGARFAEDFLDLPEWITQPGALPWLPHAGPGNRARIESIAQEIQDRAARVDAKGLFERGLGQTAEMAPGMAAVAVSALMGGEAALAVKIPGWIGAGAGVLAGSFGLERDTDAADAVDASGKPLDPHLQFAVRNTVGAVNGLIELATFRAGVRLIPGGKQWLERMATKTVQDAWKRPLFRQAVRRLAKDYVTALGVEPAQEVAQDFVPMMVRLVGQQAQGGEWKPEDWRANMQSLARTYVSTLEAMAVGGGLMGSPTLATDMIHASAVARTSAQIESLTDSAKASKLLQRLGPKWEEAAARMQKEHGTVKNIYVKAEHWNAVAKAAGIDPAVAANDVTGSESQYTDAMRDGGEADLVIPVERYIARVANTEMGAALLEHVRLYQKAPSSAEAEQAAQEQKEIIAKVEEWGKSDEPLTDPAEQSIYEAEYRKVLAVKPDPVYADTAARLRARTAVVLAERAGVDPLKFYGTHEVSIGAEPVEAGEASLAQRARPDWADEFEAAGGKIDPDGTVLLYHGTTKESAASILSEGTMRSPADASEDYGVHFSTSPQIGEHYGDGSVVPVRVRVSDLSLEDAFPDGRMDFKANTRGHSFRPVAVGETAVTPKQRMKQEDQGRIDFTKGGRQFDITLFKSGNPSTLFHETAHFYLEALGDLIEGKNDLAPTAPTAGREQLARDYKTVLAFMGVKGRAQIKRAQHEQFARLYEQYLFEGKSPSEEMRGVFSRISAWMFGVYSHLRRIVALTPGRLEIWPEIRAVFDRMTATDAQIAAAETQQRLDPIPKLAEGMSEEVRAAYLADSDAATQEARDEVRAAVESSRSEMQVLVDRRREEITAEVEKQFATQPLMRALLFLQKGRVHDGEVPDALKGTDGKPLKLSADIILERYGAAALKEMQTRDADGTIHEYTYTRVESHAADPEDLAPALGYPDGAALVADLRGAPRYVDQLEEAVGQHIAAIYGEELAADTPRLQDAALAAVQSDARVRQILAELTELRRQIGGPPQARINPFNPADMRAAADRQIRGKTVAALQPHVYSNSARAHAAKAFKAIEAGHVQAAYDQKVLQLWNMHLFRSARDFKSQADTAVQMFRAIQQKTAQQMLGRAGWDYLDQVNAQLERFELRPSTGPGIQRRKALREWIAELQAQHEAVVINPDLLDRAKMHFREMQVADLLTLRDNIKNIVHLASVKDDLIVAGKKRRFAEVRSELIASAEASVAGGGRADPSPVKNRRFRAREAASAFDSSLLRHNEVIEWLDGRDRDGAWYRNVWLPLVDAGAREGDYQVKFVKKLSEAFSNLPMKDRQRLLNETVRIDSLNRSITRASCLAVAFNTGSVSNLDRLNEAGIGMDGWHTKDGTLSGARDEILATLNEKDWDFVQSIWDTLEDLWPDIADLERRQTGLAPEKVVARSFERFGKVYRGGYYPLVYSKVVRAGQGKLESGDSLQVLFSHGHAKAQTPSGHTVSREKHFMGSIYVETLDPIVRHTQAVIRDLSFREALLNAYRIWHDKDISAVLLDKLGQQRYNAFDQHLRNLAGAHHSMGLSAFENVLRQARVNMSIVALGLKATTTFQNYANVGQVSEQVSARWFYPALATVTLKPGETLEMVKGKSGVMRHRFNEMERYIGIGLERQLRAGKLSKAQLAVQQFAFSTMMFTDAHIAYGAWLGAYNKAIHERKTEAQAVVEADHVVTSALGSFAPVDRANIETGGEWVKGFTLFYSWGSSQYVRFRALGHDIASGRGRQEGRVLAGLPWYLGRLWAIWAVPAILGELLSGRGPDDDEGWAEWMAYRAMFYPFMTVPILRDITAGVEARIRGRVKDIKYGGIATVGDELIRASHELYKQGGKALDPWESADPAKTAKAMLKVMGYTLGLPTAQFEITAGEIYDVMTGKEHPTPGQFAHDLFFRRPPKSKRKQAI